jgi:threonine/homoserine/homoserine lactone efflux protein
VLQAGIIAIFTTSFVVALSGAVMPGPLLALDIAEVAQKGFWAGPLLILGHAMLELALVVGLVKGLGRFLQNQRVMGLIGLVGGLVMLWMGSTMFGDVGYLSLSPESSGELSSGGMLVLYGALVSIANPYWSIWWATIGINYILRSIPHGIPGMASFYIGHELADLAWYSLVSFGVAAGVKMLNQAVYHGLLLACGVALLGLGIYFIVSGIQRLKKAKVESSRP